MMGLIIVAGVIVGTAQCVKKLREARQENRARAQMIQERIDAINDSLPNAPTSDTASRASRDASNSPGNYPSHFFFVNSKSLQRFFRFLFSFSQFSINIFQFNVETAARRRSNEPEPIIIQCAVPAGYVNLFFSFVNLEF